MIIDLYGLPGSGKTTLKKSLEIKYHSNCNMLKNKSKKSIKKRFILFRVFMTIYYLVINGPSIMLCGLRIVGIKNLLKSSTLKQFLTLNKKIYEIKKNVKKKQSKIIINDHGLIQSILSVVHDRPLDVETTSKYLNYVCKPHDNIRFVYCDCSVVTCQNRLSQREGAKSRVENMDYIKQFSTLEIIRQNAEKITEILLNSGFHLNKADDEQV